MSLGRIAVSAPAAMDLRRDNGSGGKRYGQADLLTLRSPRLTGSSRTSRARSIGPPRMRRCWPPSTTSSARSALTSTAAGCTNPSSTGRRPAPALISRPGYGTSPSSGGSPRRSTTPGPRPRAPLAVKEHLVHLQNRRSAAAASAAETRPARESRRGWTSSPGRRPNRRPFPGCPLSTFGTSGIQAENGGPRNGAPGSAVPRPTRWH